MDIQQAKQKAESILKQDGIDNLLVKLFLAVKYYPFWVTRDDFDTKLNFGVTSIHSLPDSMSIGYQQKDVPMMIGEFEGMKFKVGGDSYHSSCPDDNTRYQIIRFGFGEDLKTVVEAEFSLADDPCIPSDYSLSGVEEFHYSEDWIDFLKSTSQAIDTHKENQERARLQEQNEKYAGKFNF